MGIFINNAWAAAAPSGGGSPFLSFVPLLILFAVFYFLLIRPQQKRAKAHRKLLEELSQGDEVVTNGGVLGRITEVGEQFVVLEVADKIKLKVQRQAVGALMPKGTIKNV